MTPSESHKFHNRREQDLTDHMLSIDDEERQTFNYLREHSPGPPIQEDDEWTDEFNDEAMDVDHVLDGTNPVDLSHEGGKFYEIIKQCIEGTSK